MYTYINKTYTEHQEIVYKHRLVQSKRMTYMHVTTLIVYLL